MRREDLLPVIRITLLVLLTLSVGVVQNVFLLGLRFPLLLLVPWTVCVSMHEGELTSLLIGALSGAVYDLASPVHDGVFAFLFALFSLFACLLAKHKFRHTATGAVILAFIFGSGVCFIHFVYAALRDGPFSRELLTGTLFPMELFAAVIAPLVFYPLGALERKLR